MKKNLFIVVLLMGVAVGGNVPCAAQSESKGKPEKEIRTWTAVSGETFEGEYASVSGDSVRIRAANGQIITVPVSQLSDQDQLYVEYKNPPKLKVEALKTLKTDSYGGEMAYNNQGKAEIATDPIYLTEASFGATVTQQGKKPYNHDLFVEIYALTEQRYDPKKKHLIAHIKTGAFRLNEGNKFTYTYENDDIYRILKYDTRIDGSYTNVDMIRGEEFFGMLVLVRDENGEVVGYNATSEFLYTYLDRLEQLPVNAWIDNKCVRVHPTSPDATL